MAGKIVLQIFGIIILVALEIKAYPNNTYIGNNNTGQIGTGLQLNHPQIGYQNYGPHTNHQNNLNNSHYPYIQHYPNNSHHPYIQHYPNNSHYPYIQHYQNYPHYPNNHSHVIAPNPYQTTPPSHFPQYTTPTLHHTNATQLREGVCIKHVNSTKTKLVCCDGYKLYKHNKKICVPNCKNCKNGVCVAPNHCECFPGFIKSLNGDCVHTCPLGCLNGKCHSDGTCTCNVGYRYLNSSNNQICVPICSKPCGYRQNCTAPDTCDCNNGYAKLDPKSDVCQPVCNLPCGQGQCIAPGQCSCYPGYNLINGTCQGYCPKGCINGRCVEHGFCGCDPGWTIIEKPNVCLPVCSMCIRGKCVAPEKCECHHGYELKNGKCEPKCLPRCKLGKICVAPNKCKCKVGYVESNFGNCIQPFKLK